MEENRSSGDLMNDTILRDKFRGALLGTMVGDSLGAPVEDFPCEQLNAALDGFGDFTNEQRRELFGQLSGMEIRPGSAYYTDDTQMMIGVAESLIAYPEFDPAHLASRFVANFEGHRGYGPGAYAVMQELTRGEPWDEVAGRLFGGQGSYGNGAAMRVAPVGALYHDRLPRLRRVAEAQSAITHTHMLGKQGAVIEAAAVAAALRFDPYDENIDFDAIAFLNEITDATGYLENWFAQSFDDLRLTLRLHLEPMEVAETLGNGIEAHLSVPAALYSFAAHYDSFAQAVLYAVRLGGDTDTIGAMTGAIAGAFHGASAIPENWLAALENGPQGRDYVRALADRLFDTWKARRKG